MRRRMLHRDGQAQANQCSSDRGMSNEGFVMVKVSVLRAPGLHEDRCYPSSQLWTSLSRLFIATAESISSVQLLSELALGRHAMSPFRQDVVKQLRDDVKVILARESIEFERAEGDRMDVPIDYRLLGGMLKAAADPEVSIASFAQGVRVGPGSRMPRCPRLYAKKKKWRIPEQREQVDVDGSTGNTRCVEQKLLDALLVQGRGGRSSP